MNLYLRDAQIGDMQLLFDWVNSKSSLQNKEKTLEPITWSVHKKWFNDRLSDANTRIWIIESTQKQVGQMRVELDGDRLYVDIFIDELYRRKGYALKAMQMLIKQCSMIWPSVMIVAIVKNHNHKSISLFRRVGFEKSGSDQSTTKLTYSQLSENISG